MKRDLRYFLDVIIKRFWSFCYFTIGIRNSISNKIELAGIQKSINHSFSDYFYPYAFFDKSSDIDRAIVFNKDHIAVGPHGYHSIDKPLLLYTAYYGLLATNHFYKYKTFDHEMDIDKYGQFIVKYIQPDGGVAYWVDFELFGLKSPWYSGISQAIVASFLIRCYHITKNERYLNNAKLCIDFMLKDESLNITSLDDMPWIEEYASTPASYVLNGFIFSIISLSELYSITKEIKYLEKATLFENSMLKSIKRYLTPYGIRHNLYQKKLGNCNYDALHTFLFFHMYRITENEDYKNLFRYYYKKTNWNLFFDMYHLDDKKYLQQIQRIFQSVNS